VHLQLVILKKLSSIFLELSTLFITQCSESYKHQMVEIAATHACQAVGAVSF
jgi:hypothetical protein